MQPAVYRLLVQGLRVEGSRSGYHMEVTKPLSTTAMRNAPLVTIGLPVYNAERTVLDAVRSVLAQTYTNWQLLVVDDGSTDDTVNILQRIADPRVEVVYGEENRGLPVRLNQISARARGVYIARLDADDLLHPERIATQVEYMEAHPNVDVVGSGMYTLDNNDQVTGVRYSHNAATDLKYVLQRGVLLHATILSRRDWMVSNPYDETLRRGQDRELWCRTFDTSEFFALQKPLYFCREGGGMSPKQYLRKYLGNRDTRLLLLNRYGWKHLGLRQTGAEIFASFLKGEVHRILVYLGVHSGLTLRDAPPVAIAERELAQQIIQRVRAVPIRSISATKDVSG